MSVGESASCPQCKRTIKLIATTTGGHKLIVPGGKNPATKSALTRALGRLFFSRSWKFVAVLLTLVAVSAWGFSNRSQIEGFLKRSIDSISIANLAKPLKQDSATQEVPDNQPNAIQPSPPPVLQSPPAPALVMNTEEIVNQVDPAVCQIRTQNSVGTGFLITSKWIATNKHVIENAGNGIAHVAFPDPSGKFSFEPCRVHYESNDVDFAILELLTPSKTKPIEFHQEGEIRKGERVLVFGNPSGFRNVVTEGLLGSFQELDGATWLQLSMSINPGNSGGPVITLRGKAAGIVTLKSSNNEGIGLAIPGSKILEILERLKP